MHEYGARVTHDDDGTLRFLRANGREMPACDDRAYLARTSVGVLDVDVPIDAWTSYPKWDGRRPDYGHIIGTSIPAETHTP